MTEMIHHRFFLLSYPSLSPLHGECSTDLAARNSAHKNDHNQDPGGIRSLLTHLGQSGIDLFLEDINWLGAFDQYRLCLSIYSVGHQE